MAKRKRLTPPQGGITAGAKAAGPSPLPVRVPIADVAGASARAAAFDEVAGELARAREEGRLILTLPLDAVRADHLIRDRAGLSGEALGELKASLGARGQQTPVEVVALGDGTYGLLSGWRRLLALRALHDETGEDRFATVQALLRMPEDQAAAYTAMVEENEIREGLSFFERARIVRKAVEAGVFPGETAALRGLFASAAYAKRSKIKAFLPLVDALDGVLSYPSRIPEHTGLALARVLRADATLAGRIVHEIRAVDPEDPAAEARMLARLAAAPKPPAPEAEAITVTRGRGKVTLSGPGVTEDFLARLETWLRDTD